MDKPQADNNGSMPGGGNPDDRIRSKRASARARRRRVARGSSHVGDIGRRPGRDLQFRHSPREPRQGAARGGRGVGDAAPVHAQAGRGPHQPGDQGAADQRPGAGARARRQRPDLPPNGRQCGADHRAGPGAGLGRGASPSGADQPVAANAAAAEAPPSVAEIIVTGTKRPENVQNVPTSVFVATKANLEQASVRDFDDLTRLVPGLTITKTTQPANNSINIRGVGTYAYSIATEASVAVVIDDMPQAFQAEAFNSLTDTAQVEVLRGPQSTLFGKSASAGVIVITTEAPTNVMTSGGSAMATNDGEERGSAYVSGPINDQLKFRLSASADDYKGNLYNVATREWIDGHDDTNVRAKLIWQPAADWSVAASPYWDNTRASCCTTTDIFVSPGVTFGKFGAAKYQAPASRSSRRRRPRSKQPRRRGGRKSAGERRRHRHGPEDRAQDGGFLPGLDHLVRPLRSPRPSGHRRNRIQLGSGRRRRARRRGRRLGERRRVQGQFLDRRAAAHLSRRRSFPLRHRLLFRHDRTRRRASCAAPTRWARTEP